MERKHALLSASSSHKWLHCTPSARIEDALPDSTSPAAEEGTLAHAICELKLNRLFIDPNMTKKTFTTRHNKLKKDPLYQPEMERYTQDYVDYIQNLAYSMAHTPFMVVEKRLDYSKWAPEGFGTGDCVVLQGCTMHLIDFKYGKGVAVEAEANPQLQLYALGALDEFSMIYPIEKVILHVVQPRLNQFLSYELSKDALLEWGEWVKVRAELAYKGGGECVQGSYCDSSFCKNASTCRARSEENLALLEQATDSNDAPIDINILSDEEVGAILKKAQYLKKWVDKLEEYGKKQLLAGKQVEGWKLVEGRSNRTISDVDTVMERLEEAGYAHSVLYEEKPLTLTGIEKLVAKEEFKVIVAPHVMKPKGKPTMVPFDDKRVEMQLQTDVNTAFGGENAVKEEN